MNESEPCIHKITLNGIYPPGGTSLPSDLLGSCVGERLLALSEGKETAFFGGRGITYCGGGVVAEETTLIANDTPRLCFSFSVKFDCHNLFVVSKWVQVMSLLCPTLVISGRLPEKACDSATKLLGQNLVERSSSCLI